MNLSHNLDIVKIINVIGTFVLIRSVFECKYLISPNAMVIIFDCVLIACQYYFSSIKHVMFYGTEVILFKHDVFLRFSVKYDDNSVHNHIRDK